MKDPQVLMQQAKKGDMDAFGYLYELYYTPLVRFTRSRVSDKEQAEDIVQEVFFKALKAKERWQQASSPRAYFFTIARRSIIDYYRKHTSIPASRAEIELDAYHDETEDGADQALKTHTQKTLSGALEAIHPTYREVLELRFFAELSYTEVATLLEKQEATVRKLQSRALQALSKQIDSTHIT